MNKLFLCLLFVSGLAQAQNGTKLPPLDKSPMDMAYFPHNYPVLKIQNKATEPLVARVIYSRPQKNNRVIFGELVEYNDVWRLGANEATEIDFFRDVRIGNKKIPKGRYTMYAIVKPDQWTVILNKETDIWGAFKYDATKDVLRINLPVQNSAELQEAFTMNFDKTTSGANLLMGWDNIQVALPISLK